MNIELKEVLAVCNQIRGNDEHSGSHYLLGYLWASSLPIERERIFNMFTKDLLMQQGENK